MCMLQRNGLKVKRNNARRQSVIMHLVYLIGIGEIFKLQSQGICRSAREEFQSPSYKNDSTSDRLSNFLLQQDISDNKEHANTK